MSTAFVAHLPKLSDDQAAKVISWAACRSIDAHIVAQRSGSHDLYAVLEEGRGPKALLNLLNTNLSNWRIKRPKYQRGWLEVLTVDEYLALAGPSPLLQDLVTQTIKTAVGKSIAKFEYDKHQREQLAVKMARAMETAMVRNTLECTALAWSALAAPIGDRKEKQKQDAMNEERRRELQRQAELQAQRKRLQEEERIQREEEQRQRDEEDRQRAEKEREWGVKRVRLQRELQDLLGVCTTLPYNMENVETLRDIPEVRARLDLYGL